MRNTDQVFCPHPRPQSFTPAAACCNITGDRPVGYQLLLIATFLHRRTAPTSDPMAAAVLLLRCLVLSSVMTLGWSASQFDDQFDPFDDSFYEPGPPYLGDVVKNVPRVGRRNDFFLKAAKSVPRIGRRSDFESSADARDDIFIPKVSKNVPRVGRRNDFFLKAAKSVPRIGRRNDFFLKAAKSVPRIGRREENVENSALPKPDKRSGLTNAIEGGEVAAWPWFRNPDLIPRAFKRSEPPSGWQLVEPDIRERDRGVVLYEVNLHKELEEPRLQAEV